MAPAAVPAHAKRRGNFCPAICAGLGRYRNQSLTLWSLARTEPGIVRRTRGFAAMTAEAEVDGGGEAAAPAKKKLPIMLIAMIAAAVVLLGGGAAAYFFLFSAPKPAEDHAAMPESFTFNLPPMTVNLNNDDGSAPAFMKLTVALEVASEEVMTEIQPRMAKVVDAFQVYLRELRKSDLEGSAGIYRLKEELRRRVNIAIFPQQVDSILFKEILVPCWPSPANRTSSATTGPRVRSLRRPPTTAR